MTPLIIAINSYQLDFRDKRNVVRLELSAMPGYNQIVEGNQMVKRQLVSGINQLGFRIPPTILVDGSLACDMSVPSVPSSDIDGLVITDETTSETQKMIDSVVLSLGYNASNLRLFSPSRPPRNSDKQLVALVMMIRGEYLQGLFNPDEIAGMVLGSEVRVPVAEILRESARNFVDEYVNKYSPRLEGGSNRTIET